MLTTLLSIISQGELVENTRITQLMLHTNYEL